MIKNDLQFRYYFYLWVAYCNLDPKSVIIDSLEKNMKDYLLTPGYRTICLNENGVRCSVVVHDFDTLYTIYLKLGEI